MYVYTALADIIHILLSGSEAELPDGCLRTPRVLKRAGRGTTSPTSALSP